MVTSCGFKSHHPHHCMFQRRIFGALYLDFAPIAQLDRAFDYGSKGCGFNSCQARHFIFFKSRDVAQLGSALDLGSRGRRFESCHPDHAIFYFTAGQLSWLEQSVHTRSVVSSSLTPATNLDPQLSWLELPAHNRQVVGSSPTGSTTLYGGIPKRFKGLVLKTSRCESMRGFESHFLRHIVQLRIHYIYIAGQSSLVARRAHNPEVVGSNPSPATNFNEVLIHRGVEQSGSSSGS